MNKDLKQTMLNMIERASFYKGIGQDGHRTEYKATLIGELVKRLPKEEREALANLKSSDVEDYIEIQTSPQYSKYTHVKSSRRRVPLKL